MSMLVSERCFLKCPGCYNEEKTGQPLSAEQNINFAKILKKIGYKAITLSGGDPLARGDIKQIIQGIDELGFEINLDTTGIPLLDNEFDQPISAQEISKTVDLIGIPLDGSNDEIISKFRTKEGSTLVETEKILELLEKEGCRISINTAVHSGNIDNLNEIYQIISKYPSVARWELHQFVSLDGGSKTNESQFSVTDDDFCQAVSRIENNTDIVISPKPRQNKQNFSYLDFNGDFIKITDGESHMLFNIKGMDEDGLLEAVLILEAQSF